MSRYVKLSLFALATVSTFAFADHRMKYDPMFMDKANLVQAVTTAEQHANGKAMSVEFERSWQGSFYEVQVANGDKISMVRVDFDKGTVASSGDALGFCMYKPHKCEKRRYVATKLLESNVMKLAQAMELAEQHAKGKALEAKFERSWDGWVYDVDVANGAGIFDVRIDAEKGSVISSAEKRRKHGKHEHDRY